MEPKGFFHSDDSASAGSVLIQDENGKMKWVSRETYVAPATQPLNSDMNVFKSIGASIGGKAKSLGSNIALAAIVGVIYFGSIEVWDRVSWALDLLPDINVEESVD